MTKELGMFTQEEYKKWVDVYEAPVGYEDYFKWDTGIAP